MRRILKYSLIFALIFITLTGCATITTSVYEPSINTSNFNPVGQTTFSVTELQSGSALVTFDLLEEVSHYEIEVSNTNEFLPEFTKELISLEETYRMYFDDNSELYLRAKAITKNGKNYEVSNVYTVLSPYANEVVKDEFNLGYTEGWSVLQGTISSDFYSLIVKPTTIASTIKIEKEFTVDLSKAEVFEIKWITKNTSAFINTTLTIDDISYPVTSDMEVVDRGYVRFDLTSLNLDGIKNIKVTIESEGNNTGYQLDYVRFIYESEHQNIISLYDSIKTHSFNQIVEGNILSITNDSEPTIISTPSVDVTFNPQEMSTLEITLSGYFPRDTFKLTISNSTGTTLFETDYLYLQNNDGNFMYNLLEQGITIDDTYTISYELSNEDIIIDKMQLIGESNLSIPVSETEWQDGVSAYIDSEDLLKLKSGALYNYGEIRKTLTVDLGETPIVFFDVEAVSGQWAVKVIPENALSDIVVVSDNGNTGQVAADLSQILQSSDITTFTFEIFIIGASAGDSTVYLNMSSITFGNSLSIVSNTSTEVHSIVSYDVNGVNVNELNSIYISVLDISPDAVWKLYLVDQNTGRKYEMKTALEKQYPQRYNRSKVGFYVYDITEITGFNDLTDFTVEIHLIGNSATIEVGDVVFTSNNNIPNAQVSAY